jgi:hypothetical protein
MSLTHLTYTQLAEADSEKPVEVLRVGTFTDMSGKEVKITEADLEAFIASFTAGAAGQDVPIDIDHQRAEAGGWIKRMEKIGEKLLAWVDWNELGRQLVGDKVYRYLSATIDLAGKVIKSVSLVNFPAVKGLKPVELSEGVFALEQDGLMNEILTRLDNLMVFLTGKLDKPMPEVEASEPEIEQPIIQEIQTMNEQELKELREQIRTEEAAKVAAELAERRNTEAQLREQIRNEERALAEQQFKARASLVEFATKITTGDAGLSVKADDIVALLEAQPTPELQEQMKAVLQAKVVKFAEVGSAGNGPQEGKMQLPQECRGDVISGELTIKDLFDNKIIPGKPEEYDFSEFSATQKGF